MNRYLLLTADGAVIRLRDFDNALQQYAACHCSQARPWVRLLAIDERGIRFLKTKGRLGKDIAG